MTSLLHNIFRTAILLVLTIVVGAMLWRGDSKDPTAIVLVGLTCVGPLILLYLAAWLDRTTWLRRAWVLSASLISILFIAIAVLGAWFEMIMISIYIWIYGFFAVILSEVVQLLRAAKNG